jgi:hypothetical protein
MICRRFCQRIEMFIQALIARSGVEAFNVTILHRPIRQNQNLPDVMPSRPLYKHTTGERWSTYPSRLPTDSREIARSGPARS